MTKIIEFPKIQGFTIPETIPHRCTFVWWDSDGVMHEEEWIEERPNPFLTNSGRV